jgi:hypothetical protein
LAAEPENAREICGLFRGDEKASEREGGAGPTSRARKHGKPRSAADATNDVAQQWITIYRLGPRLDDPVIVQRRDDFFATTCLQLVIDRVL